MRQRAGAVLPAALFVLVVLALSAMLLVRQSPAEPAVEHPPAPVGDETARRLTPVLRSAILPAAVTVALVRDPASAGFHDDSAYYGRALGTWTRVLEATGATVRTVAPGALSRDDSDVIVVASAPCLSNATRDAMLGAAARGRGVIFTGLTGTRDGGCRSVGYGLLASLTGATRADTIGSATWPFVTMPAGSALTLDMPPGARIELMPAPHVAVRHAGRDAYFSDRDLNPAAGDSALMDGAIVHDIAGGRRVVYLGFELQTLVDGAWEQGIVSLLLRNAVAFAADIPLAGPEAWPAGHAAAAVIAQDVEDEFQHARHAVDSLNAAGATGTFFLVSEIAAGHPDLVREMDEVGEIASHSENHHALGGPLGAQRDRLNRTQEQLAELTGDRVHGFRPPEERFDDRTLAAWREAGGSYVFGATNGRSAAPELVDVGDAPMVLVGRTADDDFLTVRRAGITDPVRLAEDQLAAFGKSRALGGLYIMSYHSNMMARPETAPAIAMVARALRSADSVWLTTMAEVAGWWLVRHAAETSVVRGGDRHLVVTVRNGARQPLLASTLLVTLPRGARPASVSKGTLLPSASGLARISVPRLGVGEIFHAELALDGAAHAN